MAFFYDDFPRHWLRFIAEQQLYRDLDRDLLRPTSEDSFPPDEDDTFPDPTSDLSRQLSPYLNNSKFSDITLKVQLYVFHVHKLILCAWSDVFCEMLIGSQKKKTTSKTSSTVDDKLESQVYTLTESKECAEVFGDLLMFMYTETLELSKETVYPVFKLAKKYKIKDLSDLCQEFLIEKISNNAEGAIPIVSKAEQQGFTKLYEHCISVLETNFEFLPQSCLLDMKPSLFLKLIGSSTLVVSYEFLVLLRAFKWLTADGKEGHRKYTEEVISLIRFAHIAPAVLKTVSSGLLLSPKMYPRFKRLLQKLLPGAFEWKALAPDEVFWELPYHIQFVYFVRNYVRLRYYIGATDEGYQKLSLHAEGAGYQCGRYQTATRTSGAPVRVTSVSANNVYKREEQNWTIDGATFCDPASKQWGIHYHLKPSQTEHAHKVYRLIILTVLRGSDYSHPIVCTMGGIVPKRVEDKITVTLSPQLTSLKVQPDDWVNVKVSLLVKSSSDMLNVKLLTPPEIQKQKASTVPQICRKFP